MMSQPPQPQTGNVRIDRLRTLASIRRSRVQRFRQPFPTQPADHSGMPLSQIVCKYNLQLGFGKRYHARLDPRSEIRRILALTPMDVGALLRNNKKQPVLPLVRVAPVAKASSTTTRGRLRIDLSLFSAQPEGCCRNILLGGSLTEEPGKGVTPTKPKLRLCIPLENDKPFVEHVAKSLTAEVTPLASTRTRRRTKGYSMDMSLTPKNGHSNFYERYLRQLLTSYTDDPYLRARYREFAARRGSGRRGSGRISLGG